MTRSLNDSVNKMFYLSHWKNEINFFDWRELHFALKFVTWNFFAIVFLFFLLLFAVENLMLWKRKSRPCKGNARQILQILVNSLWECRQIPLSKLPLSSREVSFNILTGYFSNLFTVTKFTLSIQLIKPNYSVILPPTQHHSFFRNLPPLF